MGSKTRINEATAATLNFKAVSFAAQNLPEGGCDL
jgi:hypothetical protein